MTNSIAELLNQISGESKETLQLVTGKVTSEEPLKINIGGAELGEYCINRDISPEYGDLLLCLISDGGVFILCRLE